MHNEFLKNCQVLLFNSTLDSTRKYDSCHPSRRQRARKSIVQIQTSANVVPYCEQNTTHCTIYVLYICNRKQLASTKSVNLRNTNYTVHFVGRGYYITWTVLMREQILIYTIVAPRTTLVKAPQVRNQELGKKRKKTSV